MKAISIKITLSYLLFGVVWIFFTDFLVEQYAGAKTLVVFSKLQSVKGIIYVALSSLVIYFVSLYFLRKLKQHNQKYIQLNQIQSHVLRKPLANIEGLLELIQDKNSELPHEYQLIKDQMIELDKIIHQIVNLSFHQINKTK